MALKSRDLTYGIKNEGMLELGIEKAANCAAISPKSQDS
jgi:hypothetical protein